MPPDDETLSQPAEGSSRQPCPSGGAVRVPNAAGGSFSVTHKFHVLLVEDDECTLRLVEALLRKCNYEVSSARNGREALDFLQACGDDRRPDLILTDILMPEVSGMELMCEVFQDERWSSVPVIVMSSEQSQEFVMRAFEAGARDYLIKPVRRNELTTLWQHVWRKDKGRLLGECGGASAGSKPSSRPSDRTRVCAASEDFTVDNQRWPGGASVSYTELNSGRHTAVHPAAGADSAHQVGYGGRSQGDASCDAGAATPLGRGKSDGGASPSRRCDEAASALTRLAAPGTAAGSPAAGVPAPIVLPTSSAEAEDDETMREGEGEEGEQNGEQDSGDSDRDDDCGAQGRLAIRPLDLAPRVAKAVHWCPGECSDGSLQLPAGLRELLDVAEKAAQEHHVAKRMRIEGAARQNSGDSTTFNHSASTSAFTSFTALVPRPCTRGDALAVQKIQAVDEMLPSGVVTGSVPSAASGGSGPWWPRLPGSDADPALQQTQHFFHAFQAAVDQHQKQVAECALNRKVAIAKFREKRKARNFDKKVRYESRKRLAESRPRIKGQFVKAEVAAAYYASHPGGHDED